MIILIYYFILLTFYASINSKKVLQFDDHINFAREKRAILSDLTYKWNESIIYYKISSELYRDNIVQQLSYIMQETCLKFKEISLSNNSRHLTGFYFQKGYIDSTNFGRRLDDGQFQYLWLSQKFSNDYKILRVVLYALGVDYEHNRPDRDDYVLVNKNNILETFLPFARKRNNRTVNTYGLRYDFNSIMSLSQFEYTNNGKKTFEPIDLKLKQKNLNVCNRRLSSNDIQLINIHYCEGKCNRKSLCQNGGVQDLGSCNKCICPPNFIGRYCQRPITASTKNCGPPDIKATPDSKDMNISFYDNCGYSFTVEEGKRVEIKLTFLQRSNSTEYICTEDGTVEIKFAKDKSKTGLVTCDIIEWVIVFSEDNLLFLNFYGKTRGKRVKFTYKEVDVTTMMSSYKEE